MQTKRIQGVTYNLLPVGFLEKLLEAIFKAHGGYESKTAKPFNELTVVIHKRGFTDYHTQEMAYITSIELETIRKEYERIRTTIF